MNFNSKRTQNILIAGLSIAIISTFAMECIQANESRNSFSDIKEKPPIKNSLKDYIIEKDNILDEIESELPPVSETITDEVQENDTYIPEIDEPIIDNNNGGNTITPPVNPPTDPEPPVDPPTDSEVLE